ncbi:MAG: hypothetical protein HOJ35_05870 [Bdellovibrionales bacterium]|nr:hypothetical protein [Bdellovibrionales bacterium]
MNIQADNHRGFSLVSVMVAAGLLAGLALGITKFMQTAGKSAKGMEDAIEVNQLHGQVLLYLNNKDNCDATFGAKNLQSNSLSLKKPDGADFTAFSSGNSGVQLENIKTFSPLDNNLPSKASHLAVSNKSESDGWWVVTEYKYSKSGKGFGSSSVTKYGLRKFNNFHDPHFVSNPSSCTDLAYGVLGEINQFDLDGTIIQLAQCHRSDPSLVINNCVL